LHDSPPKRFTVKHIHLQEIILSTKSVEKSISSPDVKMLAIFFRELHKFLKSVSAYPEQHPLIKSSKERVVSLFEQALASRNEIKIIVSRDSLFSGHNCIDPANPILRNFAGSLFHRGVAAITFKKGLTGEDLHFFHEILNLNRELIWQKGGFERVLTDLGARHLQVEKIDYGMFCSTEENELEALDRETAAANSTELWNCFVNVLLMGISGGSTGPGATTLSSQPEELATAINRHSIEFAADFGEIYGDAVNLFMTHLKRGGPERDYTDFINKFATFVQALNPEMRRQFMMDICNSAIERGDLALKLLESFPVDITHEILAEIGSGETIAPPTIMKLLEKLSSKVASADGEQAEVTQPDVTEEKLQAFQIIFRENNYGHFVPAKYREKLQNFINNDGISKETLEDIDEMKDTLSGHCMDNSMSLIIIELLHTAPDNSRTEQLTANLLDLCAYFLEMGDFASLTDIYGRLQLNNTCSNSSSETAGRKINAFFSHPEFLTEVLEGVTFWGKTKFQDISALIGKIGAPFVEPLMNRLADEANISIRRFYMDCLMKTGEAARDAALARLGDSRWYFVRNLLILLCAMNDFSVVPSIRKLKKHPHAKVRQEVLRALIHFDDPEADQLLLQDMDNKDWEVRLNAIKLAEKSRSPEITKRLLSFLDKYRLANFQLELKIAAIKALAEIGNPDAIPALAQLLRSRKFFHPRKHDQLREEIVRSLSRYPLSTGKETLMDISRSSHHKLARLAAETLNNLQEKDA
jgi:HEAT repeat protein